MIVVHQAFVRAALVALALGAAACSGSTNEPPWAGRNQRVIDEHKITGRARELPAVSVPMALASGEPVERVKLPTATIAPGVVAALGWGRGALLERLEMQPGAAYPPQTLKEELILIVEDGSAAIEFNGHTRELTKDHVLYLQPGTTRSMRAGTNGFRAFEVYSPVQARSSCAGRPEHVRRRRLVSRSRRHALTRSRRRRQPERDSVDASYRSSTRTDVSPQHGTVAPHLGKERADQSDPDGPAL